ncbi:glycosyltransferase family 76 protein [Pholiota molesta]|nr:glycosyltransferase family 76 protein [Pholiota molesta]
MSHHQVPAHELENGGKASRPLFRYSIVARLFVFLLLHLASAWLPLFDASPLLVQGINKLEFPLLRWDMFHFHHIAAHGYVYEHEWAFFGAPYLMRYLALLQPSNEHGATNLLLMGMTAAVACESSQLLYSLSLYHLRSAHLAFLTSILSLIPTSPVIAYFAPYNEPFFTHFSYRGMLCCTRHEWLRASLWFALAGVFRSNGIFLSGFILWELLVQPFLAGKMPSGRTLVKASALTTIVITPFVTYHAYAYSVFCAQSDASIPEWCSRLPPSIYTYVQSKARLPFETAFQNSSITPHAIHAIIFASILLFTSHTQIVLRLAASMPLVYWAGTWLWFTIRPSLGPISIILWAAFLPPA